MYTGCVVVTHPVFFLPQPRLTTPAKGPRLLVLWLDFSPAPSRHPPQSLPINLDSFRFPIPNPKSQIPPDSQSPISPFVTAPRPRAPTAPQACCRTPIIRSPVRRGSDSDRGVRGNRLPRLLASGVTPIYTATPYRYAEGGVNNQKMMLS